MSTQRQTETCGCGGTEFIFVKDLNLAKVWKAGNKFARICVDCGNRYFLGKSMWEAARDQFVILDGETDPKPLFECPVCGEQVTGWPDKCPYCDAGYEWAEDDIIEIGDGEGSKIEPAEDDGDEDVRTLPAVSNLSASDVETMGWKNLQKYGAAVDGLVGSGITEDELRGELMRRVDPSHPLAADEPYLDADDEDDDEDEESEDTAETEEETDADT
jgi:hypothetical protein